MHLAKRSVDISPAKLGLALCRPLCAFQTLHSFLHRFFTWAQIHVGEGVLSEAVPSRNRQVVPKDVDLHRRECEADTLSDNVIQLVSIVH